MEMIQYYNTIIYERVRVDNMWCREILHILYTTDNPID